MLNVVKKSQKINELQIYTWFQVYSVPDSHCAHRLYVRSTYDKVNNLYTLLLYRNRIVIAHHERMVKSDEIERKNKEKKQ